MTPELERALLKLEYLRQTETWVNPFGVEITSHPDLGAIDVEESCADWVQEFGQIVADALRAVTPSR